MTQSSACHFVPLRILQLYGHGFGWLDSTRSWVFAQAYAEISSDFLVLLARIGLPSDASISFVASIDFVVALQLVRCLLVTRATLALPTPPKTRVTHARKRES